MEDSRFSVGASHVGDVLFEVFINSETDGSEEAYSHERDGAPLFKSESSFSLDYFFEAVDDASIERCFLGLGLETHLDDIVGHHNYYLGQA